MAHTLNKNISPDITPKQALELLEKGNIRFMNNLQKNRDMLEQVNKTKNGQYPFAAIVSCMDSRTSAELIFEQGLGDIFSIRIAGNVINDDILGSLEYAVDKAKSKLIVVLGHTGCGAIAGACSHVELEHLTGLLNKIQPAVEAENTVANDRNGGNPEFVNAVSTINVDNSVREILKKSRIIRKMVQEETIGIVGGMYNISTGKVTFHDRLEDAKRLLQETAKGEQLA